MDQATIDKCKCGKPATVDGKFCAVHARLEFIRQVEAERQRLNR